HAVVRDKMYPILEEIDKTTTLLADQQRQYLAASSQQARDIVAQSRRIALILIGLSLLASAAIPMVVQRISGVLRQVAANMKSGAEQVAGAAAQVSASGQ